MARRIGSDRVGHIVTRRPRSGVDFDLDRIWLLCEIVKAVEDQWVPLDPALRQALEALPRRAQDKKVFRFLDGRIPGGDRLVTVDAIGHRIVRLAKRAGVKLNMRVLRRGFGCRYAGKVPAQVLQKLMRHSNIAITMDYYANVDEAVEEAVLGSKRNTSRNSPSGPATPVEPATSANPQS